MGVQRGSRFFLLLAFVVLILSLVRVDAQESSSTLETTAESSTVAATTDPITSTTDPATSTTDPATSTTDPATSTTDPATTTVEPTTTPEVSSSSAIEAVASSSSTIEAVISSSSTIEAVISSSSAIEAVASSSSTIEAVISSSSAIEATTTTFAITTVDPTSTSTAVASSSTTDAGSIAAATSTDHSSTASSISAAVITTAATSTDHSSTSSASAAAEATSSSSAAAASTDHSSSTASAAAASTSSVSAASISTDHSSATSSAAAASTSSVSAASVSTDHSSATSSAAAASMVASTSSAAAASTSSVSAASVSTDHSSATSSAAAASTSTVSAIVASTSSASAASTPSVSAAATSTDHSSATSSAAAASTSSVSAMVASTSSASAASTPSVSAAATSTDHSSATSSAASASMSSAASASTLAVSAASTSSVSGAPTSSASAAAASTSSTSAASTTPAIAGSTSSMSTTHASAASTSTVASTTSATTTTTTSSTASSTPTINPGTGSGSGFPFTFGLPVSSSQGIPPNYQMCQFKNMSMSCLTHWSTGAFAPPMAGWTCRIDVASLNANVMTFFCGPPSDWISGGSTNWTQGPPMDLTNGLPLLWVNCTQSGTAMKCTAADGHTFTPYTGWECRQDTSVANVRTNFFCSDQYVPRPENWPSEAAGYQQNGYMQCSRNATTSQVTCGPDANGRYFEATSGGGFECRTDDRNALYCRYSQMDPNACMTNGTSNCSLDGYYKCMENKNIFQNASLITNRNLSLVVCNTNDTNLPFILPQDWACASAQSLGPVAATNFTGMYCRKSTASFPAGYEPGKLIVCNPNINNTTPPRSMGGPMPSPTMSSGPMAPPAMSSGVMPPPTMSSGAMPPPTTSAAPMPSASSAPMNNTGNMSGAMLRRSWAKSLLRRNAKRFGAPKRSVPVPVKDLSGPAIQLSRRSMPVDFSPISHHLSRRDNIADYYQYDNMGNITCAPGNNATYAKCYDRFGSPPLEVMRTMCKTVAVAWQNTTGATNATKTGPYYANSVLCSKSSPCAANTFPYPVTPSFSVESAGTLFKIAYVPIYLSPINTTSPSVYDASLYPVWSNATSNGPWYPFPYPLPTAVNCPSGNQGAIACVKYAWVYPQIKLPGVDCPVSTGCSNSTLLQYQPSGNATVEPTWYSNLASYPRNMFGPSVASLPAWYQGPVAYDKSWFDSTQVITSLNNLYAPFFSSEGRTLWATAITAGPMWPDLAGVSKRVMAIEKVNGAVWPTFPFAPFPSDSTSAPRAFEFFPLASIAAEKPYFTPGVADLMTMMNVTAAPPPVVVPPPVANATNPCPAPPTSGTILFIGSALEDGSTSSLRKTGSAQAVFSLDSYSCRIGVPSLYWNLDMANSTTIIATNSTSYPLSIAALTFGSHSLSVRAVIPDVTNASITYTVNVASSFVMKRPANYAILTTGNLNSSTSFPLSLDASDSIDGQDPCYFTQFKSAAALNRCKLNNVGFPRAVKPLVRFKCQTKAGNACAFPLTSTATFANLQSNTTRTTGGNVAFFASTDGSFQTITTDMPYFSLPVSSLVAGDYLFTVELVFSDETTSSPSASSPSSITLAATPTYLISALSALSPTNVFAGSAITFNSSVTTNSPIGELTFTWRIYTATQDFAIATFGRAFGRSGLRVDTTNLPESNFMISVTVRDATNVATNMATFSVIRTLPTPTNCNFPVPFGEELATYFTITCDNPSSGNLQYTYKARPTSPESVIAYPGSSTQAFQLPAGDPVTIFIRSYIPGSIFTSNAVSFNATVSAKVVAAADLGNSYANLFSASSSGSSNAVAAMESFANSLSSSGATPAQQQAAVLQIAEKLTGTIDVSQETASSASVKTEALAKLVSTGSLNEGSKAAVANGVAALASVLATTGASDNTLLSVASAAKGSVSTDAGSAAASAATYTNTMALVGDAIATSLAPGDNKTLVADGLRLDVASSTVATLPASVGAPGSVPARRRLTRRATTSCAINFGTGLTTALTPLVNPSGIVVTKSTCLDVNPFPSTNVNATNAGTSTLTAGYLALAVSQQINGANTPITIGTLAQPIKVYVPTTWTPRTAMVRREQHIFSRRTDTYTVQCIVQPTGQTAFTTDGCTATSGTVGGAGTTCSCTTVGSYSVQVKVTSVEDPPPGGPVTGSSGITKGGIAGAVIGSIAGAALIGAAVWYFAFKRPANKGQQMSQR